MPPEDEEPIIVSADVAGKVIETEKTVSLIATHLVPFLKSQAQVGSLQDQIKALEQQKAARSERPLIHGIGKTLAQVRHLPIEPVIRESIEGELVRALNAAGCTEFGAVGDVFDPNQHQAVAGGGGATLTVIHALGIACYGDVIVKAQVEVGAVQAPTLDVTPGALDAVPAE